jgi:putative hydrolase of the HAD superfamily
MSVRAVIFDVGGVLVTSPFDAFARYEAANGLPPGLLRRLNATNADTNAWARLERSEVDLATFAALYEAEAAALGHTLDGRAVLACLAGELRPEMLTALRRCHERLKTAVLTNNFGGPQTEGGGWASPLVEHVDVVIESRRVGVRKPDPAIYHLVCDELGVTPPEAVFLDDLGVNLKPARALGMTTIKVSDPDEAIAQLERAVGFPLRDAP